MLLLSCEGEQFNNGTIPQSQQPVLQVPLSNHWKISTIRSKGNSGTRSNLALGSTGNHVTFFDTSAASSILYGYKDAAPGSLWTFTPIEALHGFSDYLSMQLIGADDVRVAYFDGFNLRFARKAPGVSSFTMVTVDNNNNAGTHASFSMVGGTHAIAYQRCFLNCDELFEQNSRKLMVANSANGVAWTSEEVEDIPASQPLTSRGWGAKTFANETGNLSVVAYNGESHKLEIFDHSGAYGSFTNWTKSTIEDIGDLIEDVSVAIDTTTGLTAVAYFDDVNKILRVATRGGVGQAFTAQNAIVGGNVGKDNSVAIRASDQVIVVSAYNSDLGGMQFAMRDANGDWQDPELVVIADGGGRASSLHLDSTGVPFISFYAEDFGDLMLAERKTAP